MDRPCLNMPVSAVDALNAVPAAATQARFDLIKQSTVQ
jgi:hypothetical protein